MSVDLPAVVLVKGDDESLVRRETQRVVGDLLGDADPSLTVDDLTVDADDPAAVAGRVVDAARTPPFLSDRRIVVAREAWNWSRKDDVVVLIDYLDDPSPGTAVVIEQGPAKQGKKISPALTKAVKAAGRVVDAGGGSKDWWKERLSAAPVRLTPRARTLLMEHLGEDVARVESILETAAATWGDGAEVDVDGIEPFLGQSGGAKPWDLTDAIDGCDPVAALAVLRRLTRGSRMHPLQVLALLGSHYDKAMRLDGAGAATDQQAAEILGGKPFPAGKSRRLAARLGTEGLRRAHQWLADADVDLRGRREVAHREDSPADKGEAVLEVLVARLATLR